VIAPSEFVVTPTIVWGDWAVVNVVGLGAHEIVGVARIANGAVIVSAAYPPLAATVAVIEQTPWVVDFSTMGADDEARVQPAVLFDVAMLYVIAPGEFVVGAGEIVVPEGLTGVEEGLGFHEMVGMVADVTLKVISAVPAVYDDVAAALASMVHTPAEKYVITPVVALTEQSAVFESAVFTEYVIGALPRSLAGDGAVDATVVDRSLPMTHETTCWCTTLIVTVADVEETPLFGEVSSMLYVNVSEPVKPEFGVNVKYPLLAFVMLRVPLTPTNVPELDVELNEWLTWLAPGSSTTRSMLYDVPATTWSLLKTDVLELVTLSVVLDAMV